MEVGSLRLYNTVQYLFINGLCQNVQHKLHNHGEIINNMMKYSKSTPVYKIQ